MRTHLAVLGQIWSAPGNAGNRPAALLRALRWFVRCHRGVREPLVQPVFGSRLYPCYGDSIIAKHVMYRSEWFDYDLLHFMAAYLRPEDHFLDVGANTGLHTLLASTCVTKGRITCVEPHPANVARLRAALELNQVKQAAVLPVAAAERSGEAAIAGDDVFAHMNPYPVAAHQEAVEVKAQRLDECLPSDAFIDLCKIDVEGAEWQVLRGLTGLMNRDALPVVVFELNAGLERYGYDRNAFLGWLREMGYRYGTYRHDRQQLTLDETGFDNDIFAFTRSGLERVKERLPGLQCRVAGCQSAAALNAR